MLLVPMDQPGVEIRPIRNITGDTDFNEVFFDGAVTEHELVVGDVDRGWSVAMTLLGFERGEAALQAPIRFRNELDRLIELVRERGPGQRPRHPPTARLVSLQVEQLRCHATATSQLITGEEPGPPPPHSSSCGASTTKPPNWPWTCSVSNADTDRAAIPELVPHR